MDYRQSREYNEYYRKIGWITDILSGNIILIKRLPVLGSIIKINRCSKSFDLFGLERLIREYNAILVKIEFDLAVTDPDYPVIVSNLKKLKYLPSRFVFSPTKTSIVDLTPTWPEIISKFDRDVKRNLRSNTKSVIEFKSVDIEEIYPLLWQSSINRHFVIDTFPNWVSHWDGQKGSITTTLGYTNGILGGGTMVIRSGNTAYGLFLALNEAGKKAKLCYHLMSEAFKKAKDSGASYFDLEGIYDARYGKPKEWLGLTAFKNKFRGREVEYVSAMAKSRSVFVNQLIKLGLI